MDQSSAGARLPALMPAPLRAQALVYATRCMVVMLTMRMRSYDVKYIVSLLTRKNGTHFQVWEVRNRDMALVR